MCCAAAQNGSQSLAATREDGTNFEDAYKGRRCAVQYLWIRLWRNSRNIVHLRASYAQENYKTTDFAVAPRRPLGKANRARESAGMSAMCEPPAKADCRKRLRPGVAFGWSGHGSRGGNPGDCGPSLGGLRFGEAGGSTSVDAGRAGGSPPVAGPGRRSGRRLPGISALSLPVVSAPCLRGGDGPVGREVPLGTSSGRVLRGPSVSRRVSSGTRRKSGRHRGDPRVLREAAGSCRRRPSGRRGTADRALEAVCGEACLPA